MPATDGSADLFDSFRRIAGPILLAVLIAFTGIWYPPAVTVTGLATFKGQPLEEGQLIFSGDSSWVVVSTDRDGVFRLPPIRPGPYRVMIGGRPALPNPTPDPGDPALSKNDPSAKRQPVRTRPPRNAKQSPVEPVRPRGDAGILSWEAPPCCEESITFHFVAGDSRRAVGW